MPCALFWGCCGRLGRCRRRSHPRYRCSRRGHPEHRLVRRSTVTGAKNRTQMFPYGPGPNRPSPLGIAVYAHSTGDCLCRDMGRLAARLGAIEGDIVPREIGVGLRNPTPETSRGVLIDSSGIECDTDPDKLTIAWAKGNDEGPVLFNVQSGED